MPNHRQIMEALETRGFKAYIVGGAVRDKLLGFPVKDYDIATDADLDNIAFHTGAHPVTSRSGAPVAILDGIEIASFREDRGTTRHGTKFVRADMKTDAFRRDFTINALYEDLEGNIFDPTNRGLADLESMTLAFCCRPAGMALDRVLEDPTRILRAYRLAAQKNLRMSWGTVSACTDFCSRQALKGVAQEQIGRELNKLLLAPCGVRVANAFREMAKGKILSVVLPEVDNLRGVEQNSFHQEGDAFEHTMKVLECAPADLTLRWAALLHDIGKRPTQAEKAAKK